MNVFSLIAALSLLAAGVNFMILAILVGVIDRRLRRLERHNAGAKSWERR